MKLIFLASKELSWIWNLGFHFPKLDYHQWLKVHTFSIWEIRHLEEFNMLVLLSKQTVAQRRICPEICVHQVVVNCCSCNFFPKFWTLLLILSYLELFGFLNFVFPLLQIWIVWNWNEVRCFHAFRKTAFCLPILLTVEFKIWFENDAILIWMISFQGYF